jgi:hypothetical protein
MHPLSHAPQQRRPSCRRSVPTIAGRVRATLHNSACRINGAPPAGNTRTVEQVLVPCGHTLASVCPACAERAVDLRASQCREGGYLEAETARPALLRPFTEHGYEAVSVEQIARRQTCRAAASSQQRGRAPRTGPGPGDASPSVARACIQAIRACTYTPTDTRLRSGRVTSSGALERKDGHLVLLIAH